MKGAGVKFQESRILVILFFSNYFYYYFFVLISFTPIYKFFFCIMSLHLSSVPFYAKMSAGTHYSLLSLSNHMALKI